MAPIRVGFIGLSADPFAWANTAHLPYLLASPHYTITALCNSSLASARAAVRAHNLPSATAVYDNPTALAQDANVDLVVVSVNVAKHHALATPALRAAKAVFVEWPLGANLAEARELAQLARESGVRTVVGLQGGREEAMERVSAVLNEGVVGDVLSSTVWSAMGMWGASAVPKRMAYFIDREAGGNLVAIPLMHVLESINRALGSSLDVSTLQSQFLIQQPAVAIVDPATTPPTVLDPAHTRTAPDHILLQGRITTSTSPRPAAFSLHMREGPGLPDGTKFRWWIYGNKGQIEVTSESLMLQFSPEFTIRVYVSEDGAERLVREEKVAATLRVGQGEGEEVRQAAVNIGKVYDAFAEGRTEGCIDFAEAVKRHEFLDELWRRADAAEGK